MATSGTKTKVWLCHNGASVRRTAPQHLHVPMLIFVLYSFFLFFHLPLGGVKETVNFILSPRLAVS